VPLLDLGKPASPQEIRAASHRPATAQPIYRFGFDLRNAPQEDARQYQPLLDYLQRTTGLAFQLRFSDSADRLITELQEGQLAFAAIGAGSYLSIQPSGRLVPLVHGINAQGEAGYRAILVVAPNSPLQQVQELRGRRLAFGSRHSTQGYWIPRIMLARAGLELRDLGAYFFTGSHQACAEAVITGQADACGLQDTLARQLIASGRLDQLAASDLYPSSGIFAQTELPARIRQQVRQALLAFDPQGRDRDGLYHWDDTEMAGGFAPAKTDDYRPLADWAERLKLLNPGGGEPCD